MSSFSDFILTAFNESIPYISNIERFRKIIESIQDLVSNYDELVSILHKYESEFDITFKTDVKIFLNIFREKYVKS